MTRIPRIVVALVVLAASSCMAWIYRPEIESRGSIPDGILQPTVIESSQPSEPGWRRGKPAYRSAEVVTFVGEAQAPSLDAAQEAARRDLLAAVSNFVAVEVESESTSLESFSTVDGASQEIRDEVRTRSATTLSEVLVDGTYWQKILASALTPQRQRYHTWVHATVPRKQIQGWRQQKLEKRLASAGRSVVVVLPLTPLLSPANDVWAHGLVDELQQRLASRGDLHVADESLVRALVPAADADWSDPRLLGRIQDGLLPDVIVRGTYQRRGDLLRVTAVVQDGTTGTPLGIRTVQRSSRQVLGLAADLAAAIQGLLGKPAAGPTRPGGPGAPAKTSLAAVEAYHRAYQALQGGAYAKALAAISRAIELAPAESRSYLRMGRILERMGRFARIPPLAAVTQSSMLDVLVCTTRGREALERARSFLAERAAKLTMGTAEQKPWWSDETMSVDAVLAMAALELASLNRAGFDLSIWWDADQAAPYVPTSAVEAYWLAMLTAWSAGEREAGLEAALALASLAVRVDRFDAAERLFSDVLLYATHQNDLHLRSLSHFGLGMVKRKQGRLEEAKTQLSSALHTRAVLGEKPLLLEIYNELGGLAVERGELAEADEVFRKAWRIARQLGNEYLEAVLNNNIGVLAYNRGEVASAYERFTGARDYLKNLGESEGQIATGLNLGLVATLLGEADEAAQSFAEVDRIVIRSAQEGRLAQLSAQRASLELARADYDGALYSLSTSLLLYRGLKRRVQIRRLQNDLLAAEFRLATDHRTLQCLKESYWLLGAPVFDAPEWDRAVQTVEDIPTHRLPPHDLLVALNAASVVALTDWSPRFVGYDWSARPSAAPPPSSPVARPDTPWAAAQLSPQDQERAALGVLADHAADLLSRAALGPPVSTFTVRDRRRAHRRSEAESPEQRTRIGIRLANSAAMRFFRAQALKKRRAAGDALVELVEARQQSDALVQRPGRRRQEAQDVLPPKIEHLPCLFYLPGESFAIRARFVDDSEIFDPKLLYRNERDVDWRRISFQRASGLTYIAVIPARHLKGTLAYFMEVFDVRGNGPSTFGNLGSPVIVQPSSDPPACSQIPEEPEPPTVEPGRAAGVEIESPPPTAFEPEVEMQVPTAAPEAPGISLPEVGLPDFELLLEEPPPEPALEYKKPTEYEKILGASVADPDVLILLNPRQLEAAELTQVPRAVELLGGLLSHFKTLGLAPLEAAALLNLAALEWFEDDAESAYTHLMVSRDRYAAMGDVRGLAHCYEWLGYFFHHTDAVYMAAEHYGLALRLFEMWDSQADSERLLGYAQTIR